MAMCRQYFSCQFALKRCKEKYAARISLKNPLDSAIAEHANAVIKDDGVVLSRIQCGMNF